MANPVQLDLFANPPDGFDCPAGFSSHDSEITDKPPTKETNATKKRDKRRAWYIQTNFKQSPSDG